MSSSTTSNRQGSVAKRAGLTIALALGALAVVPAIASAATVSRRRRGHHHLSRPLAVKANSVTVTVVGANYRFTHNTPIALTETAPCVQVTATSTDCPLTGYVR